MTNRKEQLLKLIYAKISKFRTQDLKELRDMVVNKEKYDKWYCCCDPTCEYCEVCKPENFEEIQKK